jgi:hypothetical protein
VSYSTKEKSRQHKLTLLACRHTAAGATPSCSALTVDSPEQAAADGSEGLVCVFLEDNELSSELSAVMLAYKVS